MDIWQFLFLDTLGEYWTLTPTCDPGCLFMLNDQQMPKGNYTVNVNTLKVEMIPHIWMIGDATDWGWDRAIASEMEYKGE